jgi:hypothetical protein
MPTQRSTPTLQEKQTYAIPDKNTFAMPDTPIIKIVVESAASNFANNSSHHRPILHPSSPILLRRTRRPIPIHRAIIIHTNTGTRHKHFSSFLGLFLDIIAQNLVAASPHKRNKRNTNKQREAKEHHVNGYRVIVKRLVGCGVESCLREVEQTGETDDEAVDFAKGREAEDFG